MEDRVAIVLIVFCVWGCAGDRGDVIGCYKLIGDNLLNTHTGQSVDVCLAACEQVYYKYALIGNESNCFCGNSPGQFQLPMDSCATPCPKNDSQICGGDDVASVYDTEVMSPGPPASINAANVTETTVRVRWTAPNAFSVITGYVIRAKVIETYSDITPIDLEWRVSNKTFYTELLNLQPGSSYLPVYLKYIGNIL